MKPKSPVLVIDLFAPERALLLKVLESLSREQFSLRTVCADWDVHDVAAHILGGDLANLSGGRDHSSDRFAGTGWSEIVRFVNQQNQDWVEAMRRLSPRVLVDLLRFTGEQVADWFSSLDPMSTGPNVAWAGSGPMPMWLHLAREYTERWVHQAQIREAVGASALDEPRLLYPVLDTFAYALPVALADAAEPEGTHVLVEVTGSAGGTWSAVRGPGGWALYEGVESPPKANVRLGQSTAWRLWTRGIDPGLARSRAKITGDSKLADRVLNAVSMIV